MGRILSIYLSINDSIVSVGPVGIGEGAALRKLNLTKHKEKLTNCSIKELNSQTLKAKTTGTSSHVVNGAKKPKNDQSTGRKVSRWFI